jgi:tRNA pseudouridine32 synthase / 23S rRNA pseudouridine746 synthase
MLGALNLWPLSEFGLVGVDLTDPQWSIVTDRYAGICPTTGDRLSLPRTRLAETIAQRLMQQFAQDAAYAQAGKMYGILLVADRSGELAVLKAFSGLFQGQAEQSGWVPPIPGRQLVADAEQTVLPQLADLKQQLIALDQLPDRGRYVTLQQQFDRRLQDLNQLHKARKRQREAQREALQSVQELLRCWRSPLAPLKKGGIGSAGPLFKGDLGGSLMLPLILNLALRQICFNAELNAQFAHLTRESQMDGIEKRNLKRDRDAVLQPLKAKAELISHQIQTLKQQRKQLSQTLQTQMHEAAAVMNFLGMSKSLRELMPGGIPTGTGECCMPKLLNYAASQQLRPIAIAEFWWGSDGGDRRSGEFYGPCAPRCQPLLGFMLSGLNQPTLGFDLLFEDGWLIVVDKPSGLLSVPGRYVANQDSVLRRLQLARPDVAWRSVHRLDQDTSGLLVVAKDPATAKHLQHQFQMGQVTKYYEALLTGVISEKTGTIKLSLAPDEANRPYQIVDRQKGKPSQTRYRIITSVTAASVTAASVTSQTRIEFQPVTGRTHQLRVHAAIGLGAAIVGDRLYGQASEGERLHLHAKSIQFSHPVTASLISVVSPVPF